ncbi:MAG: hypothetical protein KC652_05480 [Cyanobacteria bacterium HKST-UBA01]|nr:hypothetical protein [Cyanobacteria bacterium HKST-UBA01]
MPETKALERISSAKADEEARNLPAPTDKNKSRDCSPYPRLLPDRPAIENNFGDAPEQLSKNICKIISAGGGANRIGIFGPRGSGKSSLVKSIKSELDRHDDLLFVFDVWAHSGDALRLSFLKALTHQLQEKNWLKGKDLELALERLDVLSGTRKVVRETKVIQLSYSIMAAFFLSYGLGVAAVWPDYLGHQIIPVFLSVVVAAILFILDDFGQRESHTTVRHQSREADSYEYQLAFVELLNSVFSQENKKNNVDNNRKLIICIDNMDRLSKADAKIVWSAMQSFFDFYASLHSNKECFSERIWLIAPMQYEYSKALWKTPEKSNSSGMRTVTDSSVIANAEFKKVSKSPTNSDHDELSYLEKTFQVRYEIPQILPESFHGYVVSNLKSAFGELHSKRYEEQFRLIAHLYLIWLERCGENFNPRKAILFVNSLVTSYIRWQDTPDLLTQSVYLMLKDSGSDILAIARDESENQNDKSLLLGHLKGSWRQDFLTIYYHLDYEEVRILHELKRVRLAIAKGDREALEEFKSLDGLDNLFESYFSEIKPTLPENLILLAAFANALKILETESGFIGTRHSPDSHPSHKYWQYAINLLKSTKSWNLLDSNSLRGIKVLIDQVKETEEQDGVFECTISSIVENEKLQNSNVDSWLDSALTIFQKINSIDGSFLKEGKMKVPKCISPYQLYERGKELNSSPAELLSSLSLYNHPAKEFRERVNAYDLSSQDVEVLKYCIKQFPKLRFSQLFDDSYIAFNKKGLSHSQKLYNLAILFSLNQKFDTFRERFVALSTSESTIKLLIQNSESELAALPLLSILCHYTLEKDTNSTTTRPGFPKEFLAFLSPSAIFDPASKQAFEGVVNLLTEFEIWKELMESPRYMHLSEFLFYLLCLDDLRSYKVDSECVIKNLDLSKWPKEFFLKRWSILLSLKSTLKILDLRGHSELSDSTFISLGSMSKLVDLDLRDTRISQSALSELASMIPNCRIRSDHTSI